MLNFINHKESIKTIFGIDVLPSYQHLGIATKINEKILLKRLKKKNALELFLCCKHQLIPFYEQFGFQNLGISKSTHGGVVWYDMLLNI